MACAVELHILQEMHVFSCHPRTDRLDRSTPAVHDGAAIMLAVMQLPHLQAC